MSVLLNGFLLGWSVSWPPGPVNAEMIRRGISARAGDGFWRIWSVGVGACTGDFIWALGVSLGAGALLGSLAIRRTLAAVSLFLLATLAFVFLRSAWRIGRRISTAAEPSMADGSRRRSGYWLGLLFALSSPWNLGFWFAVIGSQATQIGTLQRSLALAASVMLGAITWTLVLCIALKLGARIFARREWQIATELLTAAVMVWFAVRLLMHFP